jgi:uncharacterized cofD-like protein
MDKTTTTPHIVVIGGGTGLSVMLRGLRDKPLNITAIVTVADDGGSSGILRAELHMPPPGDIRNVLVALADVEPLLAQIMQYRFQSVNGLAGHNLGNLIIAAMMDITGDFVTAIKEMNRVFAVKGRVLPASNQAINLYAKMKDGHIVAGESKIPKATGRIEQVFIEPKEVTPLPESIQAIREADAIICGPGSLYTSVIPNLLVPGIVDEIVRSKAVKLFVCNVMTQPGETDEYKASDHMQAIYDHVDQHFFDYILVNNGKIPERVQSRYAEKGAQAVELDLENIMKYGCQVIADHFVSYQTYLRHDAEKLSHYIYQFAKERMLRKV